MVSTRRRSMVVLPELVFPKMRKGREDEDADAEAEQYADARFTMLSIVFGSIIMVVVFLSLF